MTSPCGARGFGWFTTGVLFTGEVYLLWATSILDLWIKALGEDLPLLLLMVLNSAYVFWLLPAVALGLVCCGKATLKNSVVIHGVLLAMGVIWLIVCAMQFNELLGESGTAFRLLVQR